VRRIRTERLVLEPVVPLNAEILWRIMQSAHLRDYQDVPHFTQDEFERRVRQRSKRFDAHNAGRFEWLIGAAAGSTVVGWISLRVAENGGGVAEIGYSLLAQHRGAGYAREAARALADEAFEQTDLRRLEACCVPANAASRRLLEGLGFARRKLQRNGAVVRGRPVDILIFQMTRETWQAQRCGQDGSANSIVMPASAKPK
jgi:RimJ/RimL family protein N-acetyltransferase